MRISSILLILVLTIKSFASQPKEIPALKKIFDKYKVEGSILIYSLHKNSYFGYDLKRCNTGFCPASTFKIPNTLIALESGTFTIDSVFKWNGEKRASSSWEKDMTIPEAFKESAVPVYQEIARRIGVEKMKYYTRLFNYGNLDINEENIDKFWLVGKSNITQYQQVYFLEKLYRLQLPISEKTMKITKEIMFYEAKGNYRLSGKTGWAVRQKENITWFVGFIETNKDVYIFATNIAFNENTDWKSSGYIRIELTKEVFQDLKIITKH